MWTSVFTPKQTQQSAQPVKIADNLIEQSEEDRTRELVKVVEILVGDMRQAFEKEKQTMRQMFAEELECLVIQNDKMIDDKITKAILKGLKTLKEEADIAPHELKERVATEFIKDVTEHTDESPSPDSTPASKWVEYRVEEGARKYSEEMGKHLAVLKEKIKIKNFKDLGNFVGVENKT